MMRCPQRKHGIAVIAAAAFALSLSVAVTFIAPLGLRAQESQDRFHHAKHERLFPDCATCHAGAQTPGAAMLPDAQSCRACHDGRVRPAIAWTPQARPPGNLRFDHAAHAKRLKDKGIAATQCQDCHAHHGAGRMQVERAVSSRCFECHAPREHLSDLSECSTCHVPLPQAQFADDARVAQFPKPLSHDDPGFALGGHAKAACPGRGTKEPGASTCAVCHAIQFCETCHVDAAQNECISTLGSDPRSLLHQAKARTPDSHRDPNFLMTHGHALQEKDAQCSTCHTQSSCTVCHASTPGVASSLLAVAPRPGVGAQVVRTKPPSHHSDFRTKHGPMASADPASCAACHHRAQCLDCHRGDPASGSPGYHPLGFLARHPTAAYARETSCAECHNPGSFCQTCHESAGLTSQGQLRGAGFHDANRAFLLGHGPSARMSLESCVSCHTENDCMTCHSAQGGRRFNPHGPDFNASVLREKAPQMCTVCHGAAIPK